MITFSKKLYVVQDLTTKNLIGVGELRRAIFDYKEDLKASIRVNKAMSHGLWHHQMGHLSSQAFSKASSNMQSDISSKNKNEF